MISSPAQLSLFEIAETGSFYKPGDWVKIRKVPASAKHVKCGHIYKIHVVDPIDGRLQFWNPFASQWDFLLPAEVNLAISPTDKNDSVSPASTLLDTEYIAEVADTEYIAEVADTEYIAEVADTEYIAEVADTEYIAEVADIDSVSRAISIYKPRGTARSGEYFRFSYRDGSRMRHLHIRGGNTDSLISQAKVAEVRSLLAAGVSRAEIATMLQNQIQLN